MALVCAGEVLAGTVGNLALAATKFKLKLVEQAEAGVVAKAQIHAESAGEGVGVTDAEQMVHIVARFGVERHIGILQPRARTAVGEASAGGQVVAEGEEEHRANLEGVGVAAQILQNQELIIVLVALRIAHADARNPLPFRNKGAVCYLPSELPELRHAVGGDAVCLYAPRTERKHADEKQRQQYFIPYILHVIVFSCVHEWSTFMQNRRKVTQNVRIKKISL